jgi:hypothetical protein
MAKLFATFISDLPDELATNVSRVLAYHLQPQKRTKMRPLRRKSRLYRELTSKTAEGNGEMLVCVSRATGSRVVIDA